jgi:hypothetical protein
MHQDAFCSHTVVRTVAEVELHRIASTKIERKTQVYSAAPRFFNHLCAEIEPGDMAVWSN